MDLVAKILGTLEINELALVMSGLVIVLTAVLSRFLINPLVDTIESRESLSSGTLDESKALLAEAESRVRSYDETLNKGIVDALMAKRAKIEESSRIERRKIESVAQECAAEVESVRGKIASEKEAVGKVLRDEVSRLSVEIAGKVLGRVVA